MVQPFSLKLVQQVQQANVDDEEVACAINSKLGETPGISYSEIASKAVDCGRTHLAIKASEYGKLSSSSRSCFVAEWVMGFLDCGVGVTKCLLDPEPRPDRHEVLRLTRIGCAFCSLC